MSDSSPLDHIPHDPLTLQTTTTSSAPPSLPQTMGAGLPSFMIQIWSYNGKFELKSNGSIKVSVSHFTGHASMEGNSHWQASPIPLAQTIHDLVNRALAQMTYSTTVDSGSRDFLQHNTCVRKFPAISLTSSLAHTMGLVIRKSIYTICFSNVCV